MGRESRLAGARQSNAPVGLAVLGVALLVAACHDGEGPSANNNNVRTCNGDTACDPGESPIWCDDCRWGMCYPAPLAGAPRDVLVASVYVPATPAEAAECLVDLQVEGGVLHNRLGEIVSRLNEQGWDLQPSTQMNEAIAAGTLLLVGRWYPFERYGVDAVIELLRAQVTNDATPTFQGSDQVSLDPTWPEGIHWCCNLVADFFVAGPNDVSVPLDLPGAAPVDVTLVRVSLRGTVRPDGWYDVLVGGSLPPAVLREVVYPAIAEWLSHEIATAPGSSTAGVALDALDGRCAPEVSGCDPLPPGCNDNVPDGVIDPAELRCNAIWDAAFAPDVDVDGDGTYDFVSFGFRILSAVPVTVVEP